MSSSAAPAVSASSVTDDGAAEALDGPQALHFYLLQQVLWITGLMPQGALPLPVWRSFRHSIALLARLETEEPVAIYDAFLREKADELDLDYSRRAAAPEDGAAAAVAPPQSPPDAPAPEQRALARLCCMTRARARQDAALLEAAYLRLEPSERARLRDELNTTGAGGGPVAVVLVYAPTLLQNVLTDAKGGGGGGGGGGGAGERRGSWGGGAAEGVAVGLALLSALYGAARAKIDELAAGEPRGQLSMTYQVGCYAVALWAKSISNLQAIEFVLDHNAETSEGVFHVEFAGDDAGRATRSRSS